MYPSFSIRPDLVRPVTDLIQQARHGVLRRRVDEIANVVGLTDREMSRILNMSVRGLHGKANSELLTSAASERLLLLERLVQHGLSVFDGRVDLLSRWLRTPLFELAYREEADESEDLSKPFSIRNVGSFQEPSRQQTDTLNTTEAATDTPAGLIPQSPLAVLDTVSGFSLAEDVLGRIEWGIAG